MNFWARLFYNWRRVSKALKVYGIIAGPGIIVMVADNDAGGITTYAATGAKFGYNLLWFLVILGPIAYFIQEMTVRLGAVTKRGLAEGIFYAFGPFWGWFSLIDLILVDWLTLVTEFIGMSAAMSIFGVPPLVTVLVVILIMGIMVVKGNYWTWEKLALFFCAMNLVYIPCAFIVRPSMTNILTNGFIPHLPPGGMTNTLFFFLMANIGTTIAPWMVFFQQSAVIDKGIQEKDILWGKIDTIFGSLFTVVVAAFCIIVTGTLLNGVDIKDAAQAAIDLMKINKYLGTLLAIGLFDAGLLGAICISLSSSWAFGEVFGWAHSLNNRVRETPWFYAFYFLALITAGGVILIPKAPLVLITLFVQVIAVTLLPAALVFLMVLLNNEEAMGKYKNTLFQNVVNIVIITVIITLSTMYAMSALFPGFLK